MGRRTKRTFFCFMMFIAALLVLSRIVPGYSEISVTGPDGDYHMKSTGTGSHHMRLEMSDGSFVEVGSQ